MANNENLRPFTSEQSHEEAVQNGIKGGIASGEAKRAKKSLREAMQILMNADLTGKDGKTMTGAEAMAAKAFQAALKGDWKAWEIARDTAGQNPKQTHSISFEIENLNALADMLNSEDDD